MANKLIALVPSSPSFNLDFTTESVEEKSRGITAFNGFVFALSHSRSRAFLKRRWRPYDRAPHLEVSIGSRTGHRCQRLPCLTLARWARSVPSLRGTWSGTLSSASWRDYGILFLRLLPMKRRLRTSQ